MSTIGKGLEQGFLGDDEARALIGQALEAQAIDGKNVLVVLPDLTRNAPIALLFQALYAGLAHRARTVAVMVATGTHAAMTPEQIARRLGTDPDGLRAAYPGVSFVNHSHGDLERLALLTTVPGSEIERISEGLMREPVRIIINKAVLEHDFIVLLSPVVPHEAAGFAGGNKYFFPGVAGEETIAFFHWMSAVITNPVINGTKDNPVRRFLDHAATYIPTPRIACNVVVDRDRLAGLFIGSVEESWSQAADLSARLHVRYVDRPFRKVLGVAPPYYDELWVAGKVAYKLEPVVADGGELVIYAPHMREISHTYGDQIRRVGYHVIGYFLAQMDRFRDVPRGVLAHSSNVKGVGTYQNGVERPRVDVTLATGIPDTICREINLSYRDPASIDPRTWRQREHDGVFLVENAGQDLYRLRP
jgi:nickel-dependent lactate racemase